MVKLPNHLIKRIVEFAYPTKEQMEIWKMEHYINYYKTLKDVEDVIREVKIERNGRKKVVFSLFSLSLIDTDYYFNSGFETSEGYFSDEYYFSDEDYIY